MRGIMRVKLVVIRLIVKLLSLVLNWSYSEKRVEPPDNIFESSGGSPPHLVDG